MRITAPDPGERVLLDGLDLYRPETFRETCRHAVWRTLREEAPVWWQQAPNGTGFWSVSRYADCDRVLKDPRTFTSEHGTILASVGVGDTAGGQAITVTDHSTHRQLRGPVLRKLSRTMVRRCTEEMATEVERILRPLLDGGEADFAHLMHQMPMAMLAPMMGVPPELRSEIAHWSAVSIAPEDPELNGGTAPAAISRQAHAELFDLFGETIRYSRSHPGEDVMTALTTLLLDGQPLTDRQVALNCYSLVMGAHATTPHVAAHTLLKLIERPEIWHAVRRDADLIPALVDEGTRWTSPTHHLVRRATTDTELAGTPIAEGDWVCAWVGSANRDHDVWSDPYEFRLDRSPNPHLGFGAGPHYCIGSHVSRTALTLLFGLLTQRLEHPVLVKEPVHLLSNWINGMNHMLVAAELRKAS